MTTSKHECSTRTCSFCRTFDRDRNRKGATQAKAQVLDMQMVRQARELTSLSRLPDPQALASTRSADNLEQIVLIDSLTSLLNSRTLEREMRKEFQRAHRYSRTACLCMISLDGTAELSRELGAMAGDNLLRAAAEVIQRCLRDVDLVGRYGSTDFIVILPETDQAGAAVVADRIRSVLGPELQRRGDGSPTLGAAVATACFPADGRHEEELIGKLTRAVTRISIENRRRAVKA